MDQWRGLIIEEHLQREIIFHWKTIPGQGDGANDDPK
jgi:hypothetical protein